MIATLINSVILSVGLGLIGWYWIRWYARMAAESRERVARMIAESNEQISRKLAEADAELVQMPDGREITVREFIDSLASSDQPATTPADSQPAPSA